MSGTLVGAYEAFRDERLSPKEVIVLQLLLQEDSNRLILTDGRNTIHLAYGHEEETLAGMTESLQELGFEEEYLDGSYFRFANVSFDVFWEHSKKELVVSLESKHIQLVDSGRGQEKPAKTFYITLMLSTRRQEILKRQALAKNVKKVEENEIDMDELLLPASTGGIINTNQDEMVGEEREVAATPCKSDAPSATSKDEERCFREHSALKSQRPETIASEPTSALKEKPDSIVEKDEEKENKAVENQKKEPEQEANKKKPLKITKPKKKAPLGIRQEQITEEVDMMAELGDLEEEFEKSLIKVKLNDGDTIRRGGTRIADAHELNAPQTLGHSFFAFKD